MFSLDTVFCAQGEPPVRGGLRSTNRDGIYNVCHSREGGNPYEQKLLYLYPSK